MVLDFRLRAAAQRRPGGAALAPRPPGHMVERDEVLQEKGVGDDRRADRAASMMEGASMSDDQSLIGNIKIEAEFHTDVATAFEVVVHELAAAWRRGELGKHQRVPLRWKPEGPVSDAVTGADIGRIAAWEPGEGFTIQWQSETASRGASPVEADVRFHEGESGSTRVTMRLLGWEQLLDPEDPLVMIGGVGSPGVLGWFTEWIVAPVITAASPPGVDRWLWDRRAGWPEGDSAREVYSGSDRGPHAHLARIVLDALRLQESDHLLEIGCGAGVSVLRWALDSGCQVSAVDHSATMVDLASTNNAAAIEDGRLRVTEADALSLPLGDAEVTCIAMVQVFQTLPDTVGVLRECRRVLRSGGRLASIVGDPDDHKRPPAELERRNRELAEQVSGAGFTNVEVTTTDWGQLLRASKPSTQDAVSRHRRGAR